MSTMMKAAVVRLSASRLSIEDVPMPVPGPGEILVKVEACGVCHTDLHAADGDWPVKPSAALHSRSRGRRRRRRARPWRHRPQGGRPGRRRLAARRLRCVANTASPAGRRLCEQQHNTGYSVNGGFAEYVVAVGGLCRATACRRRLRRDRADPVRRRHHLQGPQGDRGEARRVGRHLRHRRPRPHRRPVRQGDGPARRRGRHRRGQARAGAGRRRRRRRQRAPRRRRRSVLRKPAAARTACW